MVTAAASAAQAAGSGTPNGKQVFSSAGCSGCHGQNGKGSMGPGLAGNTNLSSAEHVVNQILHGGAKMPAFQGQLSNAEIAAVAGYVRNSWGNNYGDVSAQKVADIAKSGGSQQAANDGDSGSGSANSGKQQMAVGDVNVKSKSPKSSAGPTQDDLMKAADATDSWLMYNKGYNGQRWSSLDQINTDNVKDLAPACIGQLGATGTFESNPVVYDGLLYITTPDDTTALDATNCKVEWTYQYKPSGPEPFPTNRGVAIADGRVFRGTTDGHFLALDAKSGDLLWESRPVDSGKGYFLSSAPVVWKNMVITGTAGADWGAPAKLFAFDVKDGHTIWTFDEVKDETFGGADKAETGGGSNWTSYTIDPDKGILYAPVGNPAPDFAAEYRPGKNLYTDSVIAVDLKTGKLDHFYQQIPNDALDRDTAAAPMLFKGKDGHMKLAVGNKAGHLFLYDEQDKKQEWRAEATTIKNAEQDGHQIRPTPEGVHVCPGVNGGVEWFGPVYDPKDNRIFTPAVDWCSTFTLGEVRYNAGQFFMGGSWTFDDVDKAQGWLRAYDAKTGDIAWKYESDLPMVAGVTPTAGGLLFTGELTGDFIAVNSKTGKVLYRFPTGGPIGGGVATYEIDGRQYVAVASGNSSRTWTPDSPAAATLVIFALPKHDIASADQKSSG